MLCYFSQCKFEADCVKVRNPNCLSGEQSAWRGAAAPGGGRELREEGGARALQRPLGPRGPAPSPPPLLSTGSVAQAFSLRASRRRCHLHPCPRGLWTPRAEGECGVGPAGDRDQLACCVPPEQLRNSLLSVSNSFRPGLPLQNPLLLALMKVQRLKVPTGTFTWSMHMIII